MIKIFAFLFIFFISISSFAQKNKLIDSLEKISLKQTDTNLIKTYNELTWQYRNINPAQAIIYGNKAIQLSIKYSFDKGLAQAYNDVGIIYYDQQKFDTSLLLYNKALAIRNAHGDGLGMARLYNKIGIVYQKEGDFSRAMEMQLNAMRLFESVNNDIGISYSLNNISILCQNMNRLDDAIKYQEQSIKIKEKIKDRYGLAGSYVNLANIYLLKEDFPKAKDYYQKALVITRAIGDKEYLSNSLNNLSRFYIKTKEHANALPFAKESYELRRLSGDTKGMVSSLINLGDIYTALNKFDSAEIVLTKAYDLGNGVASCRPEMITLFTSLSTLYENGKRYNKALEMQKYYADLKDSMYTESQSQKFAELQTKFETLKKEQQITSLNKENAFNELEIKNQQLQIEKSLFTLTQNKLALSQANFLNANNQLEIQNQNGIILKQQLDSTAKVKSIQEMQKQSLIQNLEIKNRRLELTRRNIIIASLGILFLLAALLGFALYRRYKWKQEALMQFAILKQQQLATKAVMDAEDKERIRIAQDLHDGIGQMMSVAKMNLSTIEDELGLDADKKIKMDRIIGLVDESCKEVRSVSHNLMPNALLKAGLAAAVREFIDKIDHRSLQIDLHSDGLQQRLNADTEMVLYRVIQESVNNVIKHANANHLDISLINDTDGISVTVEDNGKGFNTNNAHSFEGIGLKNMRTRIEYLKGSIEWNAVPEKGTLVAIHIPLRA